MAVEQLQTFAQKPRVFILSDISNEPDDAESLCRYLLYSNQFETEGLVACTSTWMKNKVCPQDMEKIVDAYAGAVENLDKHVHPNFQYPTAEHMRSLIKKGAETYGMSAVGTDVPLSPGGQLLYDRIIAPSSQPLWILCWGGTNTLAQALLKIDDKYSPEDSKRLLSRIRVYAISDQDDTGAWIRNNFPDIFYIVSVHGWNQYGMAAWTGISGDKYYNFDQGGPDFTKMEKSWIKENIQIGPLGSAYPDYLFIPEGDTPTFLYLIQNGLGVPECPDFGSWGGRYARTDVSGEGLNSNHYSDAVDHVKVGDRTYTSNHATIWRWRNAFQNDFAARIKWSMESDFSKANHHPVVVVNDAKGLAPVRIDAEAGSTVTLDATGTYDPDGGALTFKWWHYREPTATQWWVSAEVADLTIKKIDSEGRKVEVTLPPPEKCAVDLMSRKPVEKGQLLHLILEVTDNGSPSLTSYRRVLIQATNKELKGGGEGADAIGDLMKNL
ncbi:Nn.00g012670.m01.CDS01 [Neocucurbitaria sp. VM-36]